MGSETKKVIIQIMRHFLKNIWVNYSSLRNIVAKKNTVKKVFKSAVVRICETVLVLNAVPTCLKTAQSGAKWPRNSLTDPTCLNKMD